MYRGASWIKITNGCVPKIKNYIQRCVLAEKNIRFVWLRAWQPGKHVTGLSDLFRYETPNCILNAQRVDNCGNFRTGAAFETLFGNIRRNFIATTIGNYTQ